MPRFLMCPPDHYEVAYAINEFMAPDAWTKDAARLSALAREEWAGLRRAIEKAGGTVETLEPTAGLPDLVFTANSAVVLDGRPLLGRYRHTARRGEEPIVSAWFEANFEDLEKQPEGVAQEGLGDCVWDPVRRLFWAGCGPRSDRAAHDRVAERFGAEVVSLPLVSNRFYHMDVCLMPLSGGDILYLPEAFDEDGRREIKARGGDRLIPASAEDAEMFAINCVEIDRTILLNDCTPALESALSERGYAVVRTPLSTFVMGGGGAFCLTLPLDLASDG
ncbi:MAG: arginine deiminase-related protein [Pseudomonadota bacterium]